MCFDYAWSSLYTTHYNFVIIIHSIQVDKFCNEQLVEAQYFIGVINATIDCIEIEGGTAKYKFLDPQNWIQLNVSIEIL